MEGTSKFFLEHDSFKILLEQLHKKGYQTIGPVVRDQAIIYDHIERFDELPIGYADEQNPGYYRLRKTDSKTIFADYTVGFNSAKKFTYPAIKAVLDLSKKKNGFKIEKPDDDFHHYAFIGLRPCEIAALQRLDKALAEGPFQDVGYGRYRDEIIIIAVNCNNPGNTCFCHSMNTGPSVTDGFDIALTEITSSGNSSFIAQPGSDTGLELLKSLSAPAATEQQLDMEKGIMEEAINNMGRSLSIGSLKNDLYDQFDNLHWDEIAERCLTCGNCTMVCPTCFCANYEDETDLTGQTAVRLRKWDSCFNREFSYIHGGSIRTSAKSRYRQWLMHKLSYWYDQFDTSGCVGCGRCITWCPVGIDITEEASRICSKTE